MKNKKLIKYLKLIIFIVIVAVVIRVFLFEIYLIPSDSMCQTVLDGDIVLLSKFQYGARLGFHKDKCGEIRTPALGHITRNDIVIFNFPESDTIYSHRADINFYNYAGKKTMMKALADTVELGQLAYLPVECRTPYIKRCIALPSDTFEMYSGKPYVNGKLVVLPPTIISRKNDKWISESEINERRFPSKKENNLNYWEDANKYRPTFPNNFIYRWNHDIYGPIVIPKKGTLVTLDYTNIWLYKRIIEAYEHNKLVISDSGIFINGKLTNRYTFKMNYYFMLGDNQHNSLDSMFWGFVPEDHIIGKAILVLFSSGKKENDETGIRWNRIFKGIK